MKILIEKIGEIINLILEKYIWKMLALVIAITLGIVIGYKVPVPSIAPDVEKMEETIEAKEVPEYDYFVNVAEMGTWEVPSGFEPVECELDEDVQRFAYYMAEANDIDFNFLMAVMECESGFDANCISSSDDYGLMQINKRNHEELSTILGITDFLDPYQNIVAGVYIFHILFEKYDDPAMVLMSYNMGESGASCLWNQGIYSSQYANRVLMKMQEMG